ncbi:hypothetical protein KY289_001069 [Solanum tuberosum]|nr:hypothetical protein KY289_001069 [Solanum tuberosum]
MALGLGVLSVMLGLVPILFLDDSPLFMVQFPQYTPPGVVQVLALPRFKSTAFTTWFKSIATLTSVKVLGHIYTWFKSTIILSLGSSPRLLQISVQVLDPPSSIRFKSLTPIISG